MANDFGFLVDTIKNIVIEQQKIKTTIASMIKVGPVEIIDAEKGYRLKLGENSDGTPILSPFLPHPETGKSSVPLKKGQIAGVVNPNGDPRQGILLRGGYSDEHPTPNMDMDANVFSDSGVTVKAADNALTITIGGVTATLSGSGLEITGGSVKHNGKDIGDTHKHGGVVVGGDPTDVPIG